MGRSKRKKNRAAIPGVNRNSHRDVLLGYAFVHTVIDDHSQVGYAEIHDGETAETAIGVSCVGRWVGLRCAGSPPNGSCRTTAPATSPTPGEMPALSCRSSNKRTRPYRPQTNGKIERFHRTMASKMGLRAPLPERTTRRSALPTWLHTYNHHQQHSAIGEVSPITRLTNLPGQYNQGTVSAQIRSQLCLGT